MSKSAVIQLQEEAMKTDSSITSLVRMAYVIARKLKLVEFGEWLQYKLNGYQDYQGNEWPSYRIVTGELKGLNPYCGWIPVVIKDAKIYDYICKQKISNSISELEEMIKNETDILHIEFKPDINNMISEVTGFNTIYTLFISRTNIQSICDAVRNNILYWALKLEEEGIEGRGMMFNNYEKEKAKELGSTINYFYGDIYQSQIQQNSTLSKQNISFDSKYKEKVANLLNMLKANYKSIELDGEQINAIESNISELEEIVENDNYEKDKLSKVLNSLKNILEGAGGSIVASGILYLIEQLM